MSAAQLLELLVLAVASAFWPILVAVDLIALRTPRPVRLLAWFLAAGLLTTVGEGLAIVFALDGTALGRRSGHSVGGWANVIGGAVALLLALWLRSRPAKEPAEKRSSRVEGAVARGGVFAFAAGIVLNVIPGVFPLVGMREIAALDASDGAKVALVVCFYVIMFAIIEVPLVGLLVAPERIEPEVRRFNGWLDRNGRRLAVDVLTLVGLLLVARGIVQLVS